MFGTPVSKSKGLDITVTSQKKKFNKIVIKLLIVGTFLFTTYFLYSCNIHSYELSKNLDKIVAEEDFIAPEALATNQVAEIGQRSIEVLVERDDNSDDNNDDSSNNDNTLDDSSDKDKNKSTPIYDKPGMRFVFCLFGFVILNMFAICIHHVYLKATNKAYAYKTVDDDISPF